MKIFTWKWLGVGLLAALAARAYARRAESRGGGGRIAPDDGYATASTSGHPTGNSRRRAVRGTDSAFVPTRVAANTPLDPTIDRSNDRAPYPVGYSEDFQPNLGDDASAQGWLPPTDLPAEMVAELDEAQGFQVEQMRAPGPAWELDRGDEYLASYSQPGLDDLHNARRAPSAESDGESWFEELAVESIEGGATGGTRRGDLD